MTEDLTNLVLGSNRKKVTITDVNTVMPRAEGRTTKRVCLSTIAADGATYQVYEVKVNEQAAAKSIYINKDDTSNGVFSSSTLGLLMQFLQVNKVIDLIGKEITLETKPNGYLAVALY